MLFRNYGFDQYLLLEFGCRRNFFFFLSPIECVTDVGCTFVSYYAGLVHTILFSPFSHSFIYFFRNILSIMICQRFFQVTFFCFIGLHHPEYKCTVVIIIGTQKTQTNNAQSAEPKVILPFRHPTTDNIGLPTSNIFLEFFITIEHGHCCSVRRWRKPQAFVKKK